MKDGVVRSEWSGGQGLRRLGRSASATTTVPTTTAPETDELYEAQIRKLSHIIQKANILPGHRVLEIGSVGLDIRVLQRILLKFAQGWGSMAIRIAQTVEGTKVDTLTLSVQQQSLAQERIAAAGLTDRITVHLMDYRNMPADWEGAFDRVVSIEMIEAVGSEFLVGYWRTVDWAMKPVDGVGCVQVRAACNNTRSTYVLTMSLCATGHHNTRSTYVC